MSKIFRLDFKVRDYECDMQGIVNNAVYQNYLEHTRHEYLLSRGGDFAELTDQGLNLVVTRAELDYKHPLTSGDHFYITLTARMKDRVRLVFEQNIFRNDDTLCVKALMTITGVYQRGRPGIPKELVDKLLSTSAEKT
jgi:acyl-CoA thioester hydrolase